MKDENIKNTSIFFYIAVLLPLFSIPCRLYLADPNGFVVAKVRLIDQTLL